MNPSRLRIVGIANVAVLLAALLSIGQVNTHNRNAAGASAQTSIGSAAPSTGPDSVSPSASAKAKKDASKSASPTTVGVIPSSGPGSSTFVPAVPPSQIPDFGLKTEGVTPTTVTIGTDYNKSGCGGDGAVANSFSTAVVGDPVKATTAFVNYINDTGGIRGRKLKIDLVDDGGEECPEQHKAAEIQLVDQDHVFMDIAGLHEISELLYKDHIPFDGGESQISQELKQGYGQFQVFQDADGDFANWASFCKQYIHSDVNEPCLIHPDTNDFNSLEILLKQKLAVQGLKFGTVVKYSDSSGTAAGQSNSIVIKLKAAGCKQVWMMDNNAIDLVFFTASAAQQAYTPTWTWTSRTGGVDFKLAGGLMNQKEWAHSIGLSTRIKPGVSPYENNCANIYKRYYPSDGESGSANVDLYCAGILLSAEAMRRAVDVTGVLTANSLMLGVNAIKNNFFYDATVPLSFSVPGLKGPFDFTGFDMETVAKWDTAKGDYDFPEFPYYWKLFGPHESGKINVLPFFAKSNVYVPPKR